MQKQNADSANNREIRAAFAIAYGKNSVNAGNVMTPGFWAYGYSLADPNLYFELSIGTGIFKRWLVGCTVVTSNGEKRHDLSTCFSSDDKYNALSLAREYGEALCG